MRCLQEDCANWDGDGCPCRVLDMEPVDVRHQGYCFPSLGEPCGSCHRCADSSTRPGLPTPTAAATPEAGEGGEG